MPPFQYDRYTSPYTGSLADLMREGTKAQADAELRKGSAWAQGITTAAAGVSHAVDVATDPRRKIETAQLEEHNLKVAAGKRQAEGRAHLDAIMQNSVAPALGPNDSGPQMPSFLRKEGDVSVWDTDGISKLMIAHGFASQAKEFVGELTALNNAHRAEVKARADALTAADDVMAQSAGVALSMRKRFGLSPIQALDAAVVQIRANGTVPESALEPYLSRIKSQPDSGQAILEQMAAGGHQKRLELGKDTVSVNQNNPSDVIGNPNANMPEFGTPAYYNAVRLGLIPPPPGIAAPPEQANPAAVPAAPPASVPPAAATPVPQGGVPPSPDSGTSTIAPDPMIIARGTPIQAQPSQIAPGAQAAASTVLPATAPPPVATPPPAAAVATRPPAATTTVDARLKAMDAAQRAATDATHPSQEVKIRLNGKDVFGSRVIDSTAPGGARIMYGGKDVSLTAEVIPAAGIQINALEQSQSKNVPVLTARPPAGPESNIPNPITGLTPNGTFQMSLVYATEGKLPAQGIGASPRAKAARESIENTAGALAANSGHDLPEIQAAYAEHRSALVKLGPQAFATAGFVGAATDNLQLAIDASEAVSRTGARFVNRYLQWAQGELTTNTGLTQFETYIYTAAREYAKVTNGAAMSVAGLTVSAAKEAEKLLNAAQSPANFAAAAEAMKNDMANVTANQSKELRAISSVIANFFDSINGRGALAGRPLGAPAASGVELDINGFKVRIR